MGLGGGGTFKLLNSTTGGTVKTDDWHHDRVSKCLWRKSI